MNRLGWSFGITVVVMAVEFIGGWLSGSIALISDAVHMLTHVIALGINVSGILIARRPACHHRTFGLLRAEVVAAFAYGSFSNTAASSYPEDYENALEVYYNAQVTPWFNLSQGFQHIANPGGVKTAKDAVLFSL
ncbi:MAG: cation transporter [Planctomycetota bacterium]